MEILRPIGLLIVSILITGAIAAAMPIDALVAAAWATPAGDCAQIVHPVLHTLEFVDARC